MPTAFLYANLAVADGRYRAGTYHRTIGVTSVRHEGRRGRERHAATEPARAGTNE